MFGALALQSVFFSPATKHQKTTSQRNTYIWLLFSAGGFGCFLLRVDRSEPGRPSWPLLGNMAHGLLFPSGKVFGRLATALEQIKAFDLWGKTCFFLMVLRGWF